MPPSNPSAPDPDEDLLREHVFDGIQEYDKKLPNWWLLTLYGTIVFSFFYWFYYHVSERGTMPEERLALQQERAAAHAAATRLEDPTDRDLFLAGMETSIVAAGRSAYTTNCATCHGAEGEGGIGASLIDNFWEHGNTPMEIRKVILDGAPGGMPPWRQALGENTVNQITAFIIDLNPHLREQAEEAAAAAEEDSETENEEPSPDQEG